MKVSRWTTVLDISLGHAGLKLVPQCWSLILH